MTTQQKTDNDTVQSSTTRQWTSLAVDNEVRIVTALSQREITDEAAVSIAAWWQSSGTVGSHLAALASGCRVGLEDLLADIANTRPLCEGVIDSQQLDCLATWAINHPSRREVEHVNYPHEPGRLYDCPACEARCHCTGNPGETECVFEGEHTI